MTFENIKKGDIISHVYCSFNSGDEIINVDTLKIKRFLPSDNDAYFRFLTVVIDTTNEDLSLIGYEDEFSVPVKNLYSSEYKSILLSIDKNDIERKKIKFIANLFYTRNEYLRSIMIKKCYQLNETT